MTITQAIDHLVRLRERHGDVEVEADCPRCGCSFPCGTVVTGPITARLKDAGPQETPHG